MKTVLLRLGALSLALTPVSVATPALAQDFSDPNPELVRLCKQAIEQSNSDVPLGRCVSFYRANTFALDTLVCLQWERSGFLYELGFKNVGECVKSGIAEP